jgi:DNA-binding response OmpR family regulator
MDNQLESINRDKINLKRILIVDDAADNRLMLGLRLKREGFQVSSASSGTDALKTIATEGLPDLVILDIMMPGMSGFDIAEEFRKLGNVPIIFLSALTDTETKVEGITQFAEDYITKPFEFPELLARIRRVLKRVSPNQNMDPILIIDDRLSVNFAQQYAVIDHEHIALTPTEGRILRTLYSNRGRVLSANYLLSNAWDPLRQGSVESLWVHIRRLRNKIEENPDKPQYVVTIRGQGYCLPQQTQQIHS